MISFTQEGSGKPIILLHGFCETNEMWKTFSKDLSTSYTVFCPDMPGFGDSPLSTEELNLETVAVWLSEWMEEQNIQNPVIIGHSLGGYVTLALAELMESSLRGIGLFHSTALPDTEDKRKVRNKTITFLKKHGVDKFMDSFVPSLFSEQHQEAKSGIIQQLIQAGKKTSSQAAIAYIVAMRDRKDRMELWKTFPNPKLMIAGELDTAVPIESSRLHKDFTGIYHELKGVGHMGMFEAEKESLRVIRQFLDLV